MGCTPSKNKNPKVTSGGNEEEKKHSDDRTQAQSSSGADGRPGDRPQRDAMAMTPGMPRVVPSQKMEFCGLKERN